MPVCENNLANPVSVTSTSCPVANDQTLYLQRIVESLEIAELATDQFDRPVLASDRAAAQSALALSVVIPVYNQRDTVGETLARIRAAGKHHEIILVDDFSLDGTRQILLEMAAEPDLRVLFHGYNRGKGAALRTAFQHVQGEVVLIQDADLEYDPADYPELLAPLERGEADVVYGSRFLGTVQQDSSRPGRLGNWLLTTASNLATGQRLTDLETCAKVFRRTVLDQLDLKQDRHGFEAELTAKISRFGYRIHEVPIGYQSRNDGAGKRLGLIDGFHALWCIARYGS